MVIIIDATQTGHGDGPGAAHCENILKTTSWPELSNLSLWDSDLDALTRKCRISRGGVGVWLIQVEAIKVESEEADVGLALAHLDVARGGGGLGPVGQVLAVSLSAARSKVATHPKPACTGASGGSTLKITSICMIFVIAQKI